MSATTTATRPTRRFGVDAGHDHYKWWALSCTSVGMLLATINSGTLIIALPDLERSLHTSLLTLVWVILVYMITSTVLVLSAGRLSDQFGRKNAYIGGFVVFAAASLGAGFSTGGTELIVWRVLQGIGGAFLFANAAAIVTDAFPREQLGVAMGTNTMVAAVGLVIGPVLGGALVDISWHWVFWFNVPFALLGSLWAFSILREITGRGEDTTFDAAGTLTFLLGLTGLVLGISKGGIEGWHGAVVFGGLIAAVDLPAAVRRDRAPSPVADARSHDLQQPPVQCGLGCRLPQRSVALRADVRVRLLLPGRAGRHADPGRAEARAAGRRHAGRVADRRHLRGPQRLACAGFDRDARDRDRTGSDDDASGGTPATGGPACSVHRRASARACSTRPTPRR